MMTRVVSSLSLLLVMGFFELCYTLMLCLILVAYCKGLIVSSFVRLRGR